MSLGAIPRRLLRRWLDLPAMRLLRLASVLTLLALALMVWSLVDPTLVPVIIGMSLAQVFGTVAFGLYGMVVFADVTKKRRERRDSTSAST
jgi:hypothetical protein